MWVLICAMKSVWEPPCCVCYYTNCMYAVWHNTGQTEYVWFVCAMTVQHITNTQRLIFTGISNYQTYTNWTWKVGIMSVAWILTILSRGTRSTGIEQRNGAKSLESQNRLILITLRYVSKTFTVNHLMYSVLPHSGGYLDQLMCDLK